MTYTPLLGALLLMFLVPRQDTHIIKAVATIFTLLTFAFSLYVWSQFELGTHEMQLVEMASWIPSIGVSYHFGIDGISLLLVMLTALITILAVLST
jgi:NADH-quinone oxidoreductase subunit M